MKIILASESARRKSLLNMLLSNFGLKFHVKPANIAEYIPEKYSNYPQLVKKLSKDKVEVVSKKNKSIVIGADTIVVFNNHILGKPIDEKDAYRMLKMLSGNVHKVYTGITICDENNKIYQDHEVSSVKFRTLDKNEIEYYINTGSPMDKAGSYGIQDDFGSTFVDWIHGDYFNVVGLPIVKTYLILKIILKKNNIVL